MSPAADNRLFDKPADLFFLESRLSPLTPVFKAMRKTLGSLQDIHCAPTPLHHVDSEDAESARRFSETTRIYSNDLQSLDDHLQVLLRKRESTAHLLEQMVSFRNQRIAQVQSALIMSLTKAALDDSVNVRVITVIGLVFVAFSGVAVGASLQSGV